MLDWQRSEPFCAWWQRRQQRRAYMARTVMRNATNDTSRKLAKRLIEEWKVEVG